MFEDIITISVVNFRAIWGQKEINLNRIKGYVKAAARQGSHMVILPEMALTGYDDESEKGKQDKMQTKLAETIPGASSTAVSILAQKYDIYVLFGMPEKDSKDDKVYNAAAICCPDGRILSYRKMHLPENEPNWASSGDTPLVFETPWGPVGVAICYDVYAFPELARYVSAKGSRLYINLTACCADAVPGRMIQTQIESIVITNPLYIASANLAGYDLHHYFLGGSSIIGPASNIGDVKYFAGHPFYAKESDCQEMYSATIDLSLIRFNTFTHLFKYNPKIDSTDWRPELYAKMYEEICNSKEWKEKLRMPKDANE